MKKIVFLTGTRADFGKLKSLIEALLEKEGFDVYIFATGMHMDIKYGYTVHEIEKCGYQNIYQFINHGNESMMDITLSKTIAGFAEYTRLIQPDLIVIHGDRIEALAGATVGALNNILVAHIEGGELSGTVDELIRHAVSKLSHTHFVANSEAHKRLMQMGEKEESIFVIGSPDMDVMLSDNLPSWQMVKKYYEIPFDDFALAMLHPVTTEIDALDSYAESYIDALEISGLNYIAIYPNNDRGTDIILSKLKRLQGPKFRVFPSIRFEYFLSLLKNARLIVGNSSAGIREAPCYGIPTVNIGTRQNGRSASNNDIINTSYSKESILKGIEQALLHNIKVKQLFGDGNSSMKFLDVLAKEAFWQTAKQKRFYDR